MSGSNDDAVKNYINDLKSGDESARKTAVFMLGEMKAASAAEALIDALKNDENKVVRRNAARALGKIKAENAIESLCETLHDGDYYVRQNAAWSLGKIGDKRAVEPLLRLIKGGGGKVYTDSGAAEEVTDKSSNETLHTDGMKYLDVQLQAIEALGRIGDEKAVGALIAEFDDEEAAIRRKVALALGDIGSKDAVPALLKALNDPLWYVRNDSAIALGKIGDPSVVDNLIQKLDDKYQAVGEKAAKAIEKLGTTAIAKAFLIRPKDENIKKLIKNIFKTKKDLIQEIKKAVEMEQDPDKKTELLNKIKRLG